MLLGVKSTHYFKENDFIETKGLSHVTTRFEKMKHINYIPTRPGWR